MSRDDALYVLVKVARFAVKDIRDKAAATRADIGEDSWTAKMLDERAKQIEEAIEAVY